jgi:hypothetical protein
MNTSKIKLQVQNEASQYRHLIGDRKISKANVIEVAPHIRYTI